MTAPRPAKLKMIAPDPERLLEAFVPGPPQEIRFGEAVPGSDLDLVGVLTASVGQQWPNRSGMRRSLL
jgi:hypothetical protein